MRRYACSFDWDRVLHHLRPGVLPLEPVAVPAAVRAGPGVPQAVAGQLVPQGPDRAGERAGRRRAVRALRHPGHEEEADPVVLQDHRLRRPAARRHGHAGGHLAGQGPHDAAQLDRSLDRCRRPVRDRGPRRARHDLHDPAGHAATARRSSSSPPTPTWPPSWPPALARACRPSSTTYVEQVARRERDRAAVDRPAEDRRVPGALRGQPGQRRAAADLGVATTCWPTTATARSWPCRRTTSATSTSPARSTCRCAGRRRPGRRTASRCPTRPRPVSPPPATACSVN